MNRHWLPISSIKMMGLLFVCLVIFIFHLSKGWVPILDDANLVFHEAGHLIFGLLGETMHWVGGTMGQLVFPLTMIFIYWTKQDAVATSIGIIWLFENFINIARYMADARTKVLPLVGGGEHDWAYLFGNWQILHLDTKIAGIFKSVGWLGMIFGLCWAIYLWMTIKDSPFIPTNIQSKN